MKTNLIISLAVIMLSSCEVIFKLDESVSPEIRPYFEEFKQEAARRGVSLEYKQYDIVLEPSPTGSWGLTRYYDNKRKRFRIWIDPIKYQEWVVEGTLETESNFKKLCFHEFGHGFLNRKHNHDRGSIMMQKNYTMTPENEQEYFD